VQFQRLKNKNKYIPIADFLRTQNFNLLSLTAKNNNVTFGLEFDREGAVLVHFHNHSGMTEWTEFVKQADKQLNNEGKSQV